MSSDRYTVPETFDPEKNTKVEREEEANYSLPSGWEAKEDGNGRMYYIDHINKTTQWKRPTGRASTPEYVRKAEETAARRAEIKKDIRDAASVLDWNADGRPNPPWDTPGTAKFITKARNLLTGESNADPTDVITLGSEQRTQKNILQRKIRAAADINIQKNKDQLETQLSEVLKMLTGKETISGGKRKTRKRKRKYKKRKTRKGSKTKKRTQKHGKRKKRKTNKR